MRLSFQLAIACLIFFIIGWIAAVLGPALPDLASQTHSSLTTLGGTISAVFMGALIAQLVGGPLHDRWGIRPLLGVGLVLMIVGISGIVLSQNIVLTLSAAVITGLGHGAVDIGISLFVALSFADRSVAALNFTNIFFGLGAIAGPAVAALTLQLWHTALPAIWIIGIVTAVALIVVLLMPLTHLQPTVMQSNAQVSAFLYAPLWRTAALWLLGGIFLFYVGLENGIGSWTAEFYHRTTGQPLATGALIAASFWLALTAGRVIGTFLGTRLTPQRLLTISISGAVIGGGLFFASAFHSELIVVATLVLGISCGPIYPTAIVVTTARFPQAPGRATSIVTSLGSAGGIIIPWLQGWLLIQVSTWSSTLLVVIVAVGMIVVVQGIRFPQRAIVVQPMGAA